MKRARTEVKAELMQKAELLIDELLDWNEQTKAPDLTQIEDLVLKLRTQMKRLDADERLVHQHVIEHRAERVFLGAARARHAERIGRIGVFGQSITAVVGIVAGAGEDRGAEALRADAPVWLRAAGVLDQI